MEIYMHLVKLNWLFVAIFVMFGVVDAFGAKKNKIVTPLANSVMKRIIARHELRVLSVAESQLTGLPRDQTPTQRELILLHGLADALKVDLKMIYLDNVAMLIPMLLDGEGDMIAANLTITAKRQRWIKFSNPVDSVHEQIIVSKKSMLTKLTDLQRKTIYFEHGTAYADALQKLQQQYPQLKLNAAPRHYDTEELLAQVGAGKIGAIIADSNYVKAYHHYRDDIKVIYTFPQAQQIGWGMQKQATVFKKYVNNYLKKTLSLYNSQKFTGDLTQLKKRRIIRILTRDNPRNYFIHRGHLMGFEYELAKKFAKQQGLYVVMVVPPKWEDLIPWLKHGYGDVIAAGMSITPDRKRIKGISFASSYGSFYEAIITRRDDRSFKNIFSLKGRTVVVRQSSSYWEMLKQLQKKQLGFKLIAAPENMETEQILTNVANGKYDLTMVDENIFNLDQQAKRKLKLAIRVGSPISYGWMVRENNPQLKNAISRFFRKEYRGLFYNLLYRKYYTNKKTTRKFQQQFKVGLNQQYAISKFDHLIKKHSASHKLPWCIIASQIYHESRFDAKVKAWDGGIGLMQLMPETARELGCSNPYNPDENIKAGVAYLAQLRDYVEHSVSPGNRVCFALAGYNGGYGHLRDARKLATKQGLNPNVWRNNVEKAYRLLSQTRYASQARYGSCRSDIITKYVNEILIRFQNYLITVKKFEAQQKVKKRAVVK
jgi:membrane-bound lytic murein transglycosylase F